MASREDTPNNYVNIIGKLNVQNLLSNIYEGIAIIKEVITVLQL